MTPENKDKWKLRAAIKDASIKAADGSPDLLSGTELNVAAGLPESAVWREENFA